MISMYKQLIGIVEAFIIATHVLNVYSGFSVASFPGSPIFSTYIEKIGEPGDEARFSLFWTHLRESKSVLTKLQTELVLPKSPV